jgi:F0F1-type ATP synthase assembly protein I
MSDPNGSQRAMQAAALVSTVTVSTAAGALLGYLFDRVAHTAPFGLLVGVLVGFPLGVYRLWVGLRALGFAESNDEP